MFQPAKSVAGVLTAVGLVLLLGFVVLVVLLENTEVMLPKDDGLSVF